MNSSSDLVNCTGSEFTVVPDPDIAGIGVLVAFAASAWLTLLFCVAYYCVDPEVSFTNHVGQNAPIHPVDKLCLDKLDALWTRTGRKPSDKWAQALEKAVLAFSDQQCITGIAILLSGYSQIFNLHNTKPMTVYNWQITVDLAWFSSITHLTTLTCLRHYFRQRRALSLFRIACMTVNAVILAVSIGSTGWQFVDLGSPARCLFHPSWVYNDVLSPGDLSYHTVYNYFYMAIIVTLAFSYLTRIIQLCPAKSTIRRCFNIAVTFPIAVSDRLRRSTKEHVLQSSQKLLFVHWLAYRLVLTVHCVLKAVFDLYSSMLWEITWLLIALAWGSLRVMSDRLAQVGYGNSQVVNPVGNTWGFGQVIAIILLLLPFISFSEVVYDTVFLHGSPSSSANPLFNTITITGSSVNAQHNSSPDQDLYRHRWFCMIILLTYSLSLAVAADLLYMFPYKKSVVSASDRDTAELFGSRLLEDHYAVWFSLNIVLVGAFTFFVISYPDGDSRLHLRGIGHQILLLFPSAIGQRLADSAALRPEKSWIVTLTWYITIAGILAGSVAYDWRWIPYFTNIYDD